MSQITDEIWVGSSVDASNDTFLNERRITYMLCCAEEIFLRTILYDSPRIGYKVPIAENILTEKTKEYFLEGAAILDKWVTKGGRTMVHCMTGSCRSVSVVITYLMVYKKWSFQLAFTHLKVRRYQTDPYPDFINILKEIESNCKAL